jgi:hypothetical protein
MLVACDRQTTAKRQRCDGRTATEWREGAHGKRSEDGNFWQCMECLDKSRQLWNRGLNTTTANIVRLL